MGWLLLGVLVLSGMGMAGLSWRPLFVKFWVQGDALTWVMGFHVDWVWWHFGESWLVPQTPAAHASPGMSFDPSRVRDGLCVLSWFRHLIHRAWPRVRVTEFICEGAVGFGDASDTAMTVGALSSLVGWWVVYHILPQMGHTPPRIHVEPQWDQPTLRLQFRTRFWFRPSSLIVAALQSFAVQVSTGRRRQKLRGVQHGNISGGTRG